MVNALNEPSRFLQVFGEISAKFINLSLDNIDEEIIAAQRRLCETMDIDRCSLWQFSEDHNALVATHAWSKIGETVSSELVLSEMFPWAGERLNSGETLRIPVVDELPPEASKDRETFRSWHTKSNLTFPLRTGSALIGCLAFAVLGEIRRWTDEEVRHLELVAQVFANTIDRKIRERELHETEARLHLASVTAGIGFWRLDLETGNVWATDRARALLGVQPKTKLTVNDFYDSILPEDRDKVRGQIERSLRTGEEMFVDFHTRSSVASNRWVSLRGNRNPKTSSGRAGVTGIVIDITERKKGEEDLRTSLEEIKRLKDLLYAETDFLKAELDHFRSSPEIIGESKAIGAVLRQIRQVSGTSSTVLITGETGTGKELVARAIHALSERREKVMVKVDCASLPSGLIESELFGRERGAYTGALARQIGRFQLADHSTIFLDEIGELPLEVQAKLLRILESGEFEPLGSPKTVKVNVRVIAATNRDLEKLMREGRFREDLYYRLRVFPIEVPPLRERPGDIPLLAYSFMRKLSSDMGKNTRNIRKTTMLALQQHTWPGNVRELRNLIEHALITTTGDTLNLVLPTSTGMRGAAGMLRTLAQTEEQHIRAVLEKTGWRIKGGGGAAELLGVKPSTLYAKMKKLGVPSRHQKDQIKT